MESGAKTPFPSLNDDEFLIGLMTLSEMAGCPEVLLFEPSHLLALLRRTDGKKNFTRAHKALVRFKAMTTHFEGLWYDRSTRSIDLSFSTGIIADLGWGSGKGRRKQNSVRSCRVQWTESFHKSLQNGNLLNVDLLALARLRKRPTAPHLYRITNKASFARGQLESRSVTWFVTITLCAAIRADCVEIIFLCRKQVDDTGRRPR